VHILHDFPSILSTSDSQGVDMLLLNRIKVHHQINAFTEPGQTCIKIDTEKFFSGKAAVSLIWGNCSPQNASSIFWERCKSRKKCIFANLGNTLYTHIHCTYTSFSLSHTHARKHTHTYTHTHTSVDHLRDGRVMGVSLFLPPSLSFSLIHTHIQTHIRTHIHTYPSLSLSLTHSHTHTHLPADQLHVGCVLGLSLSYTHSHTYTCTCTHIHTRTSSSLSHAHTLTHKHTHAHTHTHDNRSTVR